MSVGRNKKRRVSILFEAVVLLLIFALGSTLGFRYASGAFGKLPYLPEPISQTSSNFTPSKLTNTFQPEDFEEVDFQQFWQVWRLLEQEYVDPEKIQAKELVDGAIRGLAAGVGDPYTTYLPPADKKRTDEDLSGSFYGVGISLGYIDGTLAVMAPLKDSPAAERGVQAGDLILHVIDDQKNLDEETQGWSLNEAVSNIRGKKGTTVTLTLYRKDNGAEPFDVEIPRGEIIVPSVELEYVVSNGEAGIDESESALEILEKDGKKAALIAVSSFNERTKSEWDSAVEKILRYNGQIDTIIIDFRNNPGGLLERAIELASDFVPNGTIVTQDGRYQKYPFESTGEGRLKDYQVLVLVNKGSASASEIVAGALRDRTDALLIGEQTFGKGTVQDRKELANGGALHVTIARWLLPAGAWIHDEGIPVDIEVKDDPHTEPDEVVMRALEAL